MTGKINVHDLMRTGKVIQGVVLKA